VRNGIEAIFQGNGKGQGGGSALAGLANSLLSGLLGAPGRATGGPVAPGRAYLVGERGPEIFLPTNSGRILAGMGDHGGSREVRVSIHINGNGQEAPRTLARSARQVARAVRGALSE
jgi:phage-related minor tail protein